jgi:DNA helicase-2/ATP-dependent DNA helicase PcrA
VDVRESLLQGLNPNQREAVERIDGPLLIVAGPGSGKTRVITHRIAYLVLGVGISPRRICAVTFTNRASREMHARLDRLLGQRSQQLTAGTFHRLCATILRRDGEAIGVPPEFVIFDDQDQMVLVKRAMESAQVDPKRFPPRALLSAISSAKSQLLGPQEYLLRRDGYYEELVQRVYAAYQDLLTRNRAVDFDDLLSKVVDLFRQAPQVLAHYQERVIHLMVDEFQDTNVAQYQIARSLAGKYMNLCVVGDPDQSIYSWRNADLRNILSFQKDYPQARVIRLSQNYRSTKTILGAARQVISANRQRLDQELWTDNDDGRPLVVAEAYNEEEEALQVVREVERLGRNESYNLRDMVVTYRVNAQSRALEEACLRYGMPYKLVGGVRFYQRKEVKDVLAYLRLLQDPSDEVSLARIINVPPRGIGKRTVDDLTAWAFRLGVPAYAALQVLATTGSGRGGSLDDQVPSLAAGAPFSPRQVKTLVDFLGLLNALRHDMGDLDMPSLIDRVMEVSGYRRHLLESGDTDTEDRMDNLRELRGVASEFADLPALDGLRQFLESAALVSDQDALTDDVEQYLTLITLHQIKGLEYPVVFMVGMEENVLPHVRSLEDPDQLEEERRLAYVGMTRAKERLYLFRAFRRRLAGQGQVHQASRFLADIPPHLVETPDRQSMAKPAGAVAYDRWSSPSPVVTAAPASTDVPLKTGDRVVHASFGQGIVVSSRPQAGDFEITVAFAGEGGVKRLLYSMAKLQKKGPGSS